MTDQGLSNRLRQQSRRSGIAIGITMALTITLGIVSSAWVFGQLESVISDITGYSEDDIEPTEVSGAVAEAPSQDNNENVGDSSQQSQPEESSDTQPTVAPAEPTATQPVFDSTHISNPDFTVNLRPGPSVSSGDPITSVPPGTPLRFLGDDGTDEEGLLWLRMETEDGVEGWIRDVDTIASS